jgi:hypothetical protein
MAANDANPPGDLQMNDDTYDDRIPIVAAWNQYVKDRNRDELLLAATTDPNERDALFFVLWCAIETSDWEHADTLASRGVRVPDDDNNKPLLDVISSFGDAPDATEWLIKHGARVDVRGVNEWTALHAACRAGYEGIVRVLVAHGADVNTNTVIDGGWTPLMQACAVGNRKLVELLLDHGADPSVRNTYEGGTARDIAAKHGHHELAALLDQWSSPRARWRRARGKGP